MSVNLLSIEGLWTAELLAEELGYTRQSTINFLSKLKKQGHVTATGNKKRLYKITARKQLPRKPGMYDILNKYNPNFQIMPPFDHQAHYDYQVENALVDAVKTKNFRVLLATLKLFNNVKNWKKLYSLAKENDVWQEIGALYDVAKLFFRVRKMPEKYRKNTFRKWKLLTTIKKDYFPKIANQWKIYIPFNELSVREIKC